MKRKTHKTIALLCLLVLLVGCKQKTHHSGITSCMLLADSVKNAAQDSLFANTLYTRDLLRNAMKRIDDSTAYYSLLSMYSKSYFLTGDYDSVHYFDRQIERYCKTVPSSPCIHDLFSTVYNMEGNVYTRRLLPDSSIKYYQKAYEHRLSGNKSELLPDICINLADANVHKGDYAHTAFYYRRALFLCDSLGLSDRSKYPIYYGLGQTYMELRDFELSNYYYEMADRFLPLMNVSEKFLYLNNRGNHYYYKKEYPKALHFIGRALHTVDDYPQMVFERNVCKLNLGELFLLSGKTDSARIYLDESYRYFSEIKNYTALYYAETQMIELALQENNLPLATRMIEQSATRGHVDANMMNIRNQYLQHYYSQKGDYKKAYEYLKQDIRLDDSVRNEQVRTRVAELDLRYKQDTVVMRREMLIEKQSGQMRVLKLTMYIWVLVCAVLALGAGVIYWYMKKKRAFLQERHLNQISRLRMENIRNRLSPHFTFNVLNREISQLKSPEAKSADLGELVKLLRKSLELTEKLSISLAEELDFVKTYVHLEEGRFNDDFTMTMNIDPVLDTQSVIVPSMIVQIPVENALKHGLAGIEGEKCLDINVLREVGGVRIEICDNGRGYSPQTFSATRGTGTGLKVLYQTIQLLNEKNREKIKFNINNLTNGEHTGTQVVVYVPCDYSYEL